MEEDETLLDAGWIALDTMTLDQIVDLICTEGRYRQ